MTHHPVAIKLSGRDGKLIDDKDDVGTLLQDVGSPIFAGMVSAIR